MPALSLSHTFFFSLLLKKKTQVRPQGLDARRGPRLPRRRRHDLLRRPPQPQRGGELLVLFLRFLVLFLLAAGLGRARHARARPRLARRRRRVRQSGSPALPERDVAGAPSRGLQHHVSAGDDDRDHPGTTSQREFLFFEFFPLLLRQEKKRKTSSPFFSPVVSLFSRLSPSSNKTSENQVGTSHLGTGGALGWRISLALAAGGFCLVFLLLLVLARFFSSRSTKKKTHKTLFFLLLHSLFFLKTPPSPGRRPHPRRPPPPGHPQLPGRPRKEAGGARGAPPRARSPGRRRRV